VTAQLRFEGSVDPWQELEAPEVDATRVDGVLDAVGIAPPVLARHEPGCSSGCRTGTGAASRVSPAIRVSPCVCGEGVHARDRGRRPDRFESGSRHRMERTPRNYAS
jgi:hypothetical protein